MWFSVLWWRFAETVCSSVGHSETLNYLYLSPGLYSHSAFNQTVNQFPPAFTLNERFDIQ